MKREIPPIKTFGRDQRGSMSIELLLVVPILVWALLATFVYFDAFRAKAVAQRASLTVADMFSREQDPIDVLFMNGAQGVLEGLTLTRSTPNLRATVYTFEDPDLDGDGDFLMLWSRNRGMDADLTNDDITNLQIAEKLPILSHEDRAILIETTSQYVAPFSVGFGLFGNADLDAVALETFHVIRPRFVTQVCYDPSTSTPDDEIC